MALAGETPAPKPFLLAMVSGHGRNCARSPLARRKAEVRGFAAMIVYCPKCWAENQPGDKVCRRCGAVLKARSGEDFVDKLIGALGHPEPLTRRHAAWILGELHERRALSPLIAAAESSSDPDLLEGAVEALGKIGDASAVDALGKLLPKSYLSVKLKAVEALGRIGGPKATRLLRSALRDSSAAVREDAAKELRKMGETPSAE